MCTTEYFWFYPSILYFPNWNVNVIFYSEWGVSYNIFDIIKEGFHQNYYNRIGNIIWLSALLPVTVQSGNSSSANDSSAFGRSAILFLMKADVLFSIIDL